MMREAEDDSKKSAFGANNSVITIVNFMTTVLRVPKLQSSENGIMVPK